MRKSNSVFDETPETISDNDDYNLKEDSFLFSSRTK